MGALKRCYNHLSLGIKSLSYQGPEIRDITKTPGAGDETKNIFFMILLFASRIGLPGLGAVTIWVVGGLFTGARFQKS